MNRKELRTELGFMLNFTEGTADQDFATTRLNKALNWAYNQEVERAKLQGVRSHFFKVQEATWPASSQRFPLPGSLAQRTVYDVLNVTGGEPGYRLDSEFFFYDRATLQWAGNSGPSQDITLRFIYEPIAEELANDDMSPELVPSQFHMLIVWTAAILLREIADEMVPNSWENERYEMRLDFYKHVSRGRPASKPPQVAVGPTASGGSQFEPTLDDDYNGGLNPP